jgi:hypothetical protein
MIVLLFPMIVLLFPMIICSSRTPEQLVDWPALTQSLAKRRGLLYRQIMRQTVTLEVSDEAVRRAREVASRMRRRVEDVLAEWIDRAVAEPPVESLSDEQLLALCDLQMTSTEQEELSALLGQQSEGKLDERGRARLDALMQVYRTGLVRKAQALRLAVARGLRPPLS